MLQLRRERGREGPDSSSLIRLALSLATDAKDQLRRSTAWRRWLLQRSTHSAHFLVESGGKKSALRSAHLPPPPKKLRPALPCLRPHFSLGLSLAHHAATLALPSLSAHFRLALFAQIIHIPVTPPSPFTATRCARPPPPPRSPSPPPCAPSHPRPAHADAASNTGTARAAHLQHECFRSANKKGVFPRNRCHSPCAMPVTK